MTNPMLLTHTNDPDESRLAAINLSGSVKQQVMHIVIDLLDAHGPMTPAELEAHYQRNRAVCDWPVVALYSVHKRVSEMKNHVRVLIPVGRRDGAQLLNLSSNRVQAHTDVTAHFWRKDNK